MAQWHDVVNTFSSLSFLPVKAKLGILDATYGLDIDRKECCHIFFFFFIILSSRTSFFGPNSDFLDLLEIQE